MILDDWPGFFWLQVLEFMASLCLLHWVWEDIISSFLGSTRLQSVLRVNRTHSENHVLFSICTK